MLCGGVSLCAETAEKPYFKRFSGIEKVHRNSIKITVDLWRRGRDSNPRDAFNAYTISSRAPSASSATSPLLRRYQITEISLHIILDFSPKVKSFLRFFRERAVGL